MPVKKFCLTFSNAVGLEVGNFIVYWESSPETRVSGLISITVIDLFIRKTTRGGLSLGGLV